MLQLSSDDAEGMSCWKIDGTNSRQSPRHEWRKRKIGSLLVQLERQTQVPAKVPHEAERPGFGWDRECMQVLRLTSSARLEDRRMVSFPGERHF